MKTGLKKNPRRTRSTGGNDAASQARRRGVRMGNVCKLRTPGISIVS